jgi:hypothetical protein
MKRYNPSHCTSDEKRGALFREHSDGDWCRWEDVKKLENENTRLHEQLNTERIEWQQAHDSIYAEWHTFNERSKADAMTIYTLREALERIAKLSSQSGRTIDDYGKIAREALKEVV